MTKKITKAPSSEFEVINALSLLAHKVAPNVFDLSSLQWHVSIRDQIVRAQLLMADLCMADKDIDSVLIIGMGAAGISAAMAACEQGIPNVYVVDRADAPFKLFRGVTSRFVGPFMYEWPSSFHADQGYPEHPNTPLILDLERQCANNS
jgi:NADPH-dependent 2,4-dienoyl-CoA reductase/sulfur reductase-like enzyme